MVEAQRVLWVAAMATLLAAPAALALAWWVLRGPEVWRKTAFWTVHALWLVPAPVLLYIVSAAARGSALKSGWLVAAGVLSAAPMMARSLGLTLAGPMPESEKSARSLGLPEGRIFLKVMLPNVGRDGAMVVALAFVKIVLEYVAGLVVTR